jgi:divalent metal cation (Fe/Co/Zn/Cd) transporter
VIKPLFEPYIIKGAEEVFKVIYNQSVSEDVGKYLIKRYGDQRVMEAMADLQERMGVELSEEVGQRINRIGKLIDELHEKTVVIHPAPKRRKRRQ